MPVELRMARPGTDHGDPLRTVQCGDRIHVLESGRIVQEGTSAELAARRDGLLARMTARQAI